MSLAIKHRIDWREDAKSLEDLNRRLRRLCENIDEDFGDISRNAVGLGTSGSVVDGVVILNSKTPTIRTTAALSASGVGFLDATGVFDTVKETDLIFSDVTTGNVSSTSHGFAPKSPANAAMFLNGAATPAWALVKDSDLSVSDITTNDVSTTKHGFAPKAPNDGSKFLDGTGAYDTVKDSDLSTTDILTGNVSTAKHGFAPKAPNDPTKFLDGTGAYSTPAGGSGDANFETRHGTITPPVNGDFAWVNQGSSTITDNTSSVVLVGAATGSGGNIVARVKTAPATPYTLTVHFVAAIMQKQWQGVGILFRQSSDGKMHIFNVGAADLGLTTLDIRSSKWTSATVFNSDYAGSPQKIAQMPAWLRITDNGTNRILSWSMDGAQWIQVYTIGRTDFLTADQIGFSVSTENAATPNYGPIMRIGSWVQT